MTYHAFTSIALNYLPKARVLARSLKALHPEIHFSLLLAESRRPPDLTDDEPFDEVVVLPDLGAPDLEGWVFKHSIVELCTAVKGLYAERLLARQDCEGLLYLDPDIVVLGDLGPLVAEFADASILLTPHLVAPEAIDHPGFENELSCLRLGVFNLGFLGIGNTPDGRRFAEWWRERLERYCYADAEAGLFTDQKWVDLAPAIFQGVKVLRDAGYNVATWNLNHRHVTGTMREGLRVNGDPLRFYHFSGFDSGAQLQMLMKYGQDMPALFELRNWYIKECARNGSAAIASAPWSYGTYADGTRITDAQRRLYRAREDLQRAFPDPFATEPAAASYLHWYRHNAT
jgi:hypothetical protein